MSNPDENNADEALYRLEGTTGEQRGGLVIMKKGQSSDVDRHEFKQPAPRQSFLGLDKLAAAKRLHAVEPDATEKVKKIKSTQHERLHPFLFMLALIQWLHACTLTHVPTACTNRSVSACMSFVAVMYWYYSA